MTISSGSCPSCPLTELIFPDNIIRESGLVGGGTGWRGHVQRTDDGPMTTWTLSVICITAS
jgi:hypothetical protein